MVIERNDRPSLVEHALLGEPMRERTIEEHPTFVPLAVRSEGSSRGTSSPTRRRGKDGRRGRRDCRPRRRRSASKRPPAPSTWLWRTAPRNSRSTELGCDDPPHSLPSCCVYNLCRDPHPSPAPARADRLRARRHRLGPRLSATGAGLRRRSDRSAERNDRSRVRALRPCFVANRRARRLGEGSLAPPFHHDSPHASWRSDLLARSGPRDASHPGHHRHRRRGRRRARDRPRERLVLTRGFEPQEPRRSKLRTPSRTKGLAPMPRRITSLSSA